MPSNKNPKANHPQTPHQTPAGDKQHGPPKGPDEAEMPPPLDLFPADGKGHDDLADILKQPMERRGKRRR